MLGGSLITVLASLLIGESAGAAQPDTAAMEALADAKGCYLCHRPLPAEAKANASVPAGPSWKEIALRYRGQQGAEERLTAIILAGSGNYGKDRHWKGKAIEAGMLPNVKELDEQQARELVHWILSFPVSP